MYLSIIVPVYNEEENLEILYLSIKKVLEKTKLSWEIIFVNDGSCDNSSVVLEKLAEGDIRVKVVQFTYNSGQTAAMMAGFDHACGEIIIPIDADLQNDPVDILRLLKKIDEGYDVVSGWRKNRKDNGIKRTFPSKIANWLMSKTFKVNLHDYGCSLKAYRKDIMEGVRLYGEMHRFIPVYASMRGGKVTEIIVKHHPRKFGKSKYGINRTFKVILDIVVVKFLANYSQKPIYVFGGFGLFSFIMSIIFMVMTFYFKFWGGKSFIETPLPLLVIFFVLMGFQSVLIGLVAEIQMRTYYESQQKMAYSVKKLINF